VSGDVLTAPAADHPCTVHGYHYPRPARSVRHHIWPQEFSGPTVEANLVWVCDTGHYTVHAVLDALLAGRRVPRSTRAEQRLALLGFDRITRHAL
jgi:hypothetical protein